MASMFDLLVRIAGDGQGLRDDIDQDMLKVQELFDEFARNHSIDLSTATATEKIDYLKQKMKAVDDAHANVEIDDTQAALALDKIRAELNEIRSTDAKVFLDDTTAKAKLDDFVLKWKALNDKTVSLKVSDTAANAKIDALETRMDTMGNGRANVGGGGAGNGTLGRTATIASIIAALAPAVSPLGAAGLGGIMGLLSALAPGLAGSAGLAAVGVSNISPVMAASSGYNTNMDAAGSATTIKAQNQDIAKAELALKGLDAEQVKAVKSLQSFETFWTQFSKTFENPVLTMFTSGLKILENLLTDMKPTIMGAAEGFNELEQDASKALGSPFWKSFFSWMGTNAKQSVLAFGTGIGNLAKGFAGLLQAFSPMATEMDAGWIRMTASFAKWSAGLDGTKQFEAFLAYAAKSGAAVLSLIGNLVHLIGSLLQGMAPLGLTMVQFVSDFAKWINQLITTNPLISSLVKLVFEIAQNILLFADGIVKLFTWLGKTHPEIMNLITAIGLGTAAFFAFNAVMDANPISLIIIAIGLLITAGVELVKSWPKITAGAKKLWADIGTEFKKGVAGASALWTKLWTDMQSFVKKSGLAPYLKGYWDLMKGEFQVVLDLMTGQWGKAWTDMKTALAKIWTDIKDTTLGNMLTDAEQWGENLMHSIASGITKAVSSVISAARSAISSVEHLFGGGASVATSSSVGNMVQSSIGGSSTNYQNITVTHTGSVQVAGLTPKAVQQVNQQIYRNGIPLGVK